MNTATKEEIIDFLFSTTHTRIYLLKDIKDSKIFSAELRSILDGLEFEINTLHNLEIEND